MYYLFSEFEYGTFSCSISSYLPLSLSNTSPNDYFLKVVSDVMQVRYITVLPFGPWLGMFSHVLIDFFLHLKCRIIFESLSLFFSFSVCQFIIGERTILQISEQNRRLKFGVK
jgi:hypothetical protein